MSVEHGGDMKYLPQRYLRILCWCILAICLAGLIIFFQQKSESSLLLDSEVTKSVEQGNVLELPASDLLPNNVGYVCSFGPYAYLKGNLTLHGVDGLEDKLSRLGIFHVGEYIGYFVYIDHSGDVIQYDKLSSADGWYRLLEHSIRWHRPKNSKNGCYDISDVSFLIYKANSRHWVGLARR